MYQVGQLYRMARKKSDTIPAEAEVVHPHHERENMCVKYPENHVVGGRLHSQLAGTKPEPILSPPAVPQERLGTTFPGRAGVFLLREESCRCTNTLSCRQLWICGARMWEEAGGVPSDPLILERAREVGGWEWGRRCQPGKVHR